MLHIKWTWNIEGEDISVLLTGNLKGMYETSKHEAVKKYIKIKNLNRVTFYYKLLKNTQFVSRETLE